jgi:hypothetical protein
MIDKIEFYEKLIDFIINDGLYNYNYINYSYEKLIDLIPNYYRLECDYYINKLRTLKKYNNFLILEEYDIITELKSKIRELKINELLDE